MHAWWVPGLEVLVSQRIFPDFMPSLSLQHTVTTTPELGENPPATPHMSLET